MMFKPLFRTRTRRTLATAALITLGAGGLWLGQYFRVFDQAWFVMQAWAKSGEWQQRSLWLNDYQVSIEALAIPGVDNVSALTYDPDRNTLFSVTNKRPHLLELSLDGRVLRKIPLIGFHDTEAIEYISRGRYVISDERRQRLHLVHVDDDTFEIDAASSQYLSLGFGKNGNLGFEGLAWDHREGRLFVAREKPVHILEIRGFPDSTPTANAVIEIQDNPQRDRSLFVKDVSSLHYDHLSGHLFSLSDESRMVVEMDIHGRPISTLTLRRGKHGLNRSVPQAEGMTIDYDGNVYIVSEPNLFYVFKKPTS